MIRPEILVLCLGVGLTTYLIRFVPFLIARRLGDRKGGVSKDYDTPRGRGLRVLELIGPCIVAALLITSILPGPDEAEFGLQLVRSTLALAPVLISALIWRNLGVSVVIGISSYWLADILI